MNIFKEIKYAIQRIRKGYCDRDTWNIDWWFQKTIVLMLKDFKKNKHSYPTEFKTQEEWDNVLNKMIILFNNMDFDTCDISNPYEELWHSIVYNPQYFTPEQTKDIRKKYLEKQEEIYEQCENAKNEAFSLFSKYFHDLWD